MPSDYQYFKSDKAFKTQRLTFLSGDKVKLELVNFGHFYLKNPTNN